MSKEARLEALGGVEMTRLPVPKHVAGPAYLGGTERRGVLSVPGYMGDHSPSLPAVFDV